MKIIYDKKLLALALERKADPRYAHETKFRYKNYDYDFEKEIFPSARFQFQKYDRAYRDNKTFAQAFARDLLRRNSELITTINKGAKTPEEIIFYEEGAAQSGEVASEQPPVGEPVSTMTGGGPPFPGLAGTTSSAPTPRRIVHIVPQAEKVESKLVAANKSGVVTREHPLSTQATAGPPVDNISKEATQPVRGMKSGGARLQAPKIPSAITNKAGIFLKKNFATLASAGTGFFAGLGITGGSVFGGLMGGAGGTALRFWAGGGNAGKFFNRILNGGANFVNRLSFNVTGSKSSFIKAGGRKAAIAFLIAIGGLFLTAAFSGGSPGSPGTTPGTAAAPIVAGNDCPTQATINQNKNATSCHYLNPAIDLFDTNISADVIAQYIERYSPIFTAAGKGSKLDFTQKVDYIISNSKTAGLNPAIFLGYWKSEATFGTVGTREMGCAGSNFYEEVDCALGINAFGGSDQQIRKNPIANCAKSKDANSIACLAEKEIRITLDQTHPIKYPIATFDDFAEAYGPYDHLDKSQPTNCISTYNQLIEVAKELKACKAVLASCPIPGGQIKTPSYQANPASGHCSPGYGSCNIGSRRAKAIDVDTKGQDVLFPTINGQNVNWKYVTDLPLDKAGDCEGGITNCGRFYTFRADVGSDFWMLHLLHLDPSQIVFDKTATGNPSGSKAGKTTSNVYVHIEIGKNIVNYLNPPLGSQDLDPGWISADFMCK